MLCTDVIWIWTIEIDTLEYQQTEKIETELKDVESGKCTLAVQGGILGGHKSAPVSHKHMLSQQSFSSPLINEDLQAGPQLAFTLNNRFFRHQACYSLLPAKPGGQADRVISLCKYKVVDLNWHSRSLAGNKLLRLMYYVSCWPILFFGFFVSVKVDFCLLVYILFCLFWKCLIKFTCSLFICFVFWKSSPHGDQRTSFCLCLLAESSVEHFYS